MVHGSEEKDPRARIDILGPEMTRTFRRSTKSSTTPLSPRRGASRFEPGVQAARGAPDLPRRSHLYAANAINATRPELGAPPVILLKTPMSILHRISCAKEEQASHGRGDRI